MIRRTTAGAGVSDDSDDSEGTVNGVVPLCETSSKECSRFCSNDTVIVDGLRSRVVVIVVLLSLLGGVLVATGAMSPSPAQNSYPDEDHIAVQEDAYVGERVEVSGQVIATDPIVLETYTPEGALQFTVSGVDEPVELDDRVTVFGTLEDDGTIQVENAIVREPWEFQYMFAVSIVAAVWVLLRFVRGWRLDRTEWWFTPGRASEEEGG